MPSTKVSVENEGWLEVELGGERLEFARKTTRPGDFLEVSSRMDEEGLDPPTFFQASVFLAEALGDPGSEVCKVVTDLIQDRWLWTNTALLYLPRAGVFVQDQPVATKDGRTLRDDPFPRGLWMEEADLRSRFQCGDKGVRFVPFGFKVGSQPPSQLENNPMAVALTGTQEGARILASAACCFEKDPFLWSFEEVDRPILRVVALGTEHHGTQLVIGARCYDMGPNGNGMSAFGLRRHA
jgi:hypothetical protein